MGVTTLAPKVKALQLNTEGLLKLLGGTENDRIRYWEILKGLTTPRDQLVVIEQIAKLQTSLKEAQAGAKAIQQSMKKISR